MNPAALNNTAQTILHCADKLMAKEGLAHLSMHKLAKAANLSVGTLYVHFKDKEDLLRQLADYIFTRCQQNLALNVQPESTLFEQYRQIWLNLAEYCQRYPETLINFYEYESLPYFQQLIIAAWEDESLVLTRLFKRGQAEGQIADLPMDVLVALTLGVGLKLFYRQLVANVPLSDVIQDEVILRTWNAISR